MAYVLNVAIPSSSKYLLKFYNYAFNFFCLSFCFHVFNPLLLYEMDSHINLLIRYRLLNNLFVELNGIHQTHNDRSKKKMMMMMMIGMYTTCETLCAYTNCTSCHHFPNINLGILCFFFISFSLSHTTFARKFNSQLKKKVYI